MRPPHVFAHVSDQQYDELLSALHQQWRPATRAVMIVLSIAGVPPAEIAGLLHYSPNTVRRWISRHNAEGVQGLRDRPRSGRPRIGSPRIGQRIAALLATSKAWTVARIWRALGRPKMSLRTCYQRIREQARWARPRLIAKGAADRDAICQAIRDRVTALPVGSVVLAEDETHLDLLARVRACWMPHGTRHRILTPGSNIRHTVFGALNMITGVVHHHIAVKGVSVVFCYFLDQVLTAYPSAPIVTVICDNGTIHTSAITRRWLDQHPRLLLLHGARYSPQDNPTERVWAAMKTWIANTAPATMTDRVRQAHAFFHTRTPAQMLTTTAPWTSPWLPDGYGQDFLAPA